MPTDLGEIVRRVGTDERPVIRLAGLATREAAEALHGRALLVALEDAPPLEAGEGGGHELEGLRVTDGDRAVGTVRRMLELPSGGVVEGLRVTDGDREVGTVRRMLELPSVEVLEVERPDGCELLVPMVGDAVRELDMEGRRVDVDLRFLDAD